ncbi:MAG: glycosyltransferase, partial [Candidatus Omnitrophica bacterium]|nr:glycosyltransferase [Candidatus Omnitrophota bacterium]
GYFYDNTTGKLPLVDEGADTMIQLIEAVVAVANEPDLESTEELLEELGVETSLCGEAVTSLVNRGDYKKAGMIMGLLHSFGVSMMTVRLPVSMVRYDIMSAIKEIFGHGREVLFDLGANGEVKQEAGVIKGEIIYVKNPGDLIPDILKGLHGAALEARREFLKMQSLESARSTMRTFGKIVVLTRNFVAMTKEEFLATMSPELFDQFRQRGLIKSISDGLYIWTNLDISADRFTAELKKDGYSEDEQKAIMAAWEKAWNNTTAGLERQGIDWDDLQYAHAIILDSSVNLEGWDVFSKEKGIVPRRIKAVVSGIASLREQLEGQFATLDYAAGKIYKGNLKVSKKEFKPRLLPIPTHEPKVETITAVREDANTIYAQLKYHPLVLLLYEKELQGGQTLEESLGKIFDEYVGKLIDELDKIEKEKNAKKKEASLIDFRNKIEKEPEKIIKEFAADLIEKVTRGEGIKLTEGWLEKLKTRYFASHSEEINNIKRGMQELLSGRSASELIKDAFKQQIRQSLLRHKGELVIHTTTSLNCAEFRDMLGGFLVEQVNPNPNYGLLGAARATSDFWEVNRLELAAFKEARQEMPLEQRKNLGLQITELKGTQAGAVVIVWRHILEGMGIIPGEDGLQVGLNIATPSDTLAVDRYFEHFQKLGDGLSFVTYDRIMLGAAWAGVDIYWSEWRRLAREEELEELGGVAIKIVKGKIEKINKANDKATKRIVVFKDIDEGIAAQSTERENIFKPADFDENRKPRAPPSPSCTALLFLGSAAGISVLSVVGLILIYLIYRYQDQIKNFIITRAPPINLRSNGIKPDILEQSATDKPALSRSRFVFLNAVGLLALIACALVALINLSITELRNRANKSRAQYDGKFLPLTESDKQRQEIQQIIARDRTATSGGIISTLMLKGGENGGLNPQIKARILEILERYFVVIEGKPRTIDMRRMLLRWGHTAFQYHLRDLKEAGLDEESLAEGKRLVDLKDPAFADWFKKAGEAVGNHPKYLRIKSWIEYSQDSPQQILLIRRVSWEQILKDLDISWEQVDRLLEGKSLAEVDEQIKLKVLIVGATNVSKAHAQSLRHIVCKALQEGGVLHYYKQKCLEAGIPESDIYPMYNGIHCAYAGEELDAEINLLSDDDADSFSRVLNSLLSQASETDTYEHLTRGEKEQIPPEQIIAHWNARAMRPGVSAVMSTRYTPKENEELSKKCVASVVDFLNSNISGKRVFEHGVGIGRMTSVIAKLAREVMGNDISPLMLQRARANLSEFDKVKLLLGKVIDLDLGSKSFDLVFGSLVLGHILNPAELKATVERLKELSDKIVIVEHISRDGDNHVSKYTILRTLKDYLDLFAPYKVVKNDVHVCGDDVYVLIVFENPAGKPETKKTSDANSGSDLIGPAKNLSLLFGLFVLVGSALLAWLNQSASQETSFALPLVLAGIINHSSATVLPRSKEPNTNQLLLQVHSRKVRAKRINKGRVASGTFQDIRKGITSWKSWGSGLIYLLGVMPIGELSKRINLGGKDDVDNNLYYIRDQGGRILSIIKEEALQGDPERIGSIFSIQNLKAVDKDLGTLDDFRRLVEKSHALKMKVIVDFVGNHTAADHPWVVENTDYFIYTLLDDRQENLTDVELLSENPDCFLVYSKSLGRVLVAHGKDPRYPRWSDTAQLDYHNPKVRAEMIEVLKFWAKLADGVRCDMANLVPLDFWQEAIAETKKDNPGFIFIGEVYRDEGQYLEAGFDFVYDKHLYDALMTKNSQEVNNWLEYLQDRNTYLQRSLRFYGNHDDDWADLKEFVRPAAVISATFPGMSLVYLDQVLGYSKRIEIQKILTEGEPEESLAEFLQKQLLPVASNDIFSYGRPRLLKPRSHATNIIAFALEFKDKRAVVAVNYSQADESSMFLLPEGFLDAVSSSEYVLLRDELNKKVYIRRCEEINREGIFVSLPAFSSHIFFIEKFSHLVEARNLRELVARFKTTAIEESEFERLLKLESLSSKISRRSTGRESKKAPSHRKTVSEAAQPSYSQLLKMYLAAGNINALAHNILIPAMRRFIEEGNADELTEIFKSIGNITRGSPDLLTLIRSLQITFSHIDISPEVLIEKSKPIISTLTPQESQRLKEIFDAISPKRSMQQPLVPEIKIIPLEGEFAQIVSDLNAFHQETNLMALDRLMAIKGHREEKLKVLVGALGHDNHLVRNTAARLIDELIRFRIPGSPASYNFRIAELGEPLTIRASIPVKQQARLKVKLLYSYDTQTQSSPKEIKLRKESTDAEGYPVYAATFIPPAGVIEYSIVYSLDKWKTKNWIRSYEANGTLHVQPKISGSKMFIVWPQYDGIKLDLGNKVIKLGDFQDLRNKLSVLAQEGYDLVYVLGVYTPGYNFNDWDSHATNPTPFNVIQMGLINPELGGFDGLKTLFDEGHKLGMRFVVDLPPQISRANTEFPRSLLVQVRLGDELVFRGASDGKWGDWRDAYLPNGRRFEVWRYYLDSVEWLSDTLGADGVRFDSSQGWPIMFQKDLSVPGLSDEDKLFGRVVTTNKNYGDDSFVTTGWWETESRGILPNPLTLLLAQSLLKRGKLLTTETHWGREAAIIKSGGVPFDNGFYGVLSDVLKKGASIGHLYHYIADYQRGAHPLGARLIRFIENYDEKRATEQFPGESYRAALAALFLLGQVPSIHNGQRKGESWKIMLDNLIGHYWTGMLQARRSGVRSAYDNFEKFYDEHAALQSGAIFPLDSSDDRIFSVLRSSDEEILIVAVNFDGARREFHIRLSEQILSDVKANHRSLYRIKPVFDSRAQYRIARERILTGRELIQASIAGELEGYDTVVFLIEPVSRSQKDLTQLFCESLCHFNAAEKEGSYAYYLFRNAVRDKSFAKFEQLFYSCYNLMKKESHIYSSSLSALLHQLALEKSVYLSEILAYLELIKQGQGLRKRKLEQVKKMAASIIEIFGVGDVVFVAPEMEPFSRKGGLADVIKELPEFLVKHGIHATVIMPLYSSDLYLRDQQDLVKRYNIEYTGRNVRFFARDMRVEAAVHKCVLNGVDIYFLAHPEYANYLYGGVTTKEKLLKDIFLCRGAIEVMRAFDIYPSNIVLNDSHTSLVAPFIKTNPFYRDDPHFRNAKIIYGIHNLGFQYQGIYDFWEAGEDLYTLLNLGAEHIFWMRHPWDESKLNLTAVGLRYVDAVFTVGETYSREIQQDQFSEGLGALIREHAARNTLYGISNKLDTKTWDALLTHTAHKGMFGLRSPKTEKKRAAKLNLQKKYGLKVGAAIPILSITSRITEQKGFALIVQAARSIIAELGAQLVVMGNPASEADREFLSALEGLQNEFPASIALTEFKGVKEEALILEASDIFLMPSKWEPGGMAQLRALRAGTPVVGHAVGGLLDIIKEFDITTGKGNGFLFDEFSSKALLDTIRKAITLYRSDKNNWMIVMTNALKSRIGWEPSARRYIQMFREAIGSTLSKEDEQAAVLRNEELKTQIKSDGIPAGSSIALGLFAFSGEITGWLVLVVAGLILIDQIIQRKDQIRQIFTSRAPPRSKRFFARFIVSLVGKNTVRDALLSDFACKESDLITEFPEEAKEDSVEDDIRTPSIHARDKIRHSRFYRRSRNTTQVFFQFRNTNLSTRQSHADTVADIAAELALYFGANEYLCLAGGIGHDRHGPYAHPGEVFLNEIAMEYGFAFRHSAQSIRACRELNHLNLPFQVLDIFGAHNGEMLSRIYRPAYKKTLKQFLGEYERSLVDPDYYKKIVPGTFEGCLVRIADVISYIGKDIEEAVMLGLITWDDVPIEIRRVLGTSNSQIMNTLINDLKRNSRGKDYLEFSPEVFEAFQALLKWNTEHIYNHSRLRANEEMTKIRNMFRGVFAKFYKDLEEANTDSDIYRHFLVNRGPDNGAEYRATNSNARVVVDFIAGMSDDYLEQQCVKLGLPLPKKYGYTINEPLDDEGNLIKADAKLVSAQPAEAEGKTDTGVFSRAIGEQRRVLFEQEVYGLGVKGPKYILISNADQITAELLGQFDSAKVAMKVVSAHPKALHKSKVGGVKIVENNVEAVKAAFDAIVGTVCEKASITRDDIVGVLVCEAVDIDKEYIIGFKLDLQFGPTIAIGLGGSAVEEKAKLVYRLLPLKDESQIDSMMEEVGIPQVHRKEFKAIALKVVSILEEKAKEGIAVTQIDLNPVVITKQGDVLAVDARL